MDDQDSGGLRIARQRDVQQQNAPREACLARRKRQPWDRAQASRYDAG